MEVTERGTHCCSPFAKRESPIPGHSISNHTSSPYHRGTHLGLVRLHQLSHHLLELLWTKSASPPPRKLSRTYRVEQTFELREHVRHCPLDEDAAHESEALSRRVLCVRLPKRLNHEPVTLVSQLWQRGWGRTRAPRLPARVR